MNNKRVQVATTTRSTATSVSIAFILSVSLATLVFAGLAYLTR